MFQKVQLLAIKATDWVLDWALILMILMTWICSVVTHTQVTHTHLCPVRSLYYLHSHPQHKVQDLLQLSGALVVIGLSAYQSDVRQCCN